MSQGQSTTVDAAQIMRRVDDFENRVNDLYDTLNGWLPSGWSATKRNAFLMHEEQMQKFQVPSRHLPVMTINNGSQHSASVTPKALYIVGGNGRIDLKSQKGDFLIIDQADHFQPPDWIVTTKANPRAQQKLTQQVFQSCL